MPLENGKWRVVRGDCLWNISKSVYGKGTRWKEIANANGISQSNPTIYPGQIFTLPGITPSPTPTPTPSPDPTPAPATNKKVTFNWFALDAGTDRDMFTVWEYNRSQTDHYQVYWDYDTGAGGWRIGSHNDNCKDKQSSYSPPANAKKVRLQVKPISETYEENNETKYRWTDGEWETKEYDFSNNPPGLPPSPSVTIDSSNKMTVTLENISDSINADSIEIAVYQDNTNKYSTAKVTINAEARFASYISTVDPGHYYKVRCRAVRGNIYGGWTDFTSNEQSCPATPERIISLRPQVISEQTTKQYGIFAEWSEEKTAKYYEIQWTTNIEYFDTGSGVSSKTTEEGKGPSTLVTDIEIGHEYFFRVRSINDKGNSEGWTPIKSCKIGSKPSAPTTWSNTSSAVVGEDLNLYWTHNSTDGSLETYARINIKVIDSAHPSAQPMEYTKVIENTREDKESNGVYTINTTDPEWSGVQAGFIIKWKVQTTGIIGEYSEWSVEREVSVYAKPSLTLDLLNKSGSSIDEINSFPFYISVLATPPTQKPISYYIEVVSNGSYETVDNIGNVKVVNPGDKVYQKYYDPDSKNAWRFLLEMTPGNIDLENNISYTVNATVAMDSGLIAISSKDFTAYLNDQSYDVYADIVIDKETLTANICPYCNEYSDDTQESTLSENCTLSVYRREYDGTFTEIAADITNDAKTYVVDPHPSLDYARYRIVARSSDTGSISYADVKAVKVGEPSVVIQWSDKWSNFDYDEDTENIEPKWAGSMLKIPYNIDVTESNKMDVSLVEYAGRKHPVSYYGTQLGKSSTWNVEIPADDKELLYAIRRLSIWTGDVYVREPSGTGYWANISVSYNIKHLGVTIPVTFNIKQVEGGI